MVSKALLPSFGGSYLVWGACMVFFQTVLALGYLYAHAAQRLLGVALYSRVHLLLVVVAVLQAPFDMATLGSATPGGVPAASVFRLLIGVVGLPAFVLSTTSLVLQRWLAESNLPDRDNPYVLYAASNLGSMLGLLAYPVIVEPLLDLRWQGAVWWMGYVVLAVVHIVCRPRRWAKPRAEVAESAERTSPRRRFAWFALGLAGCAVLLAVTNVLTFDVASAPFMWVLPLAVYLMAFVLVFKRKPWFPARMRDLLGWAIVVGVTLHLMTQLRLAVPVPLAIFLHMGVLFIVCLNAAGELAALKPVAHGQLTSYYVIMSFGGLAGSAVVSWFMPLASDWLIEYPLALALTAAAVGVARAEQGAGGGERRSLPLTRSMAQGWAALCLAGPVVALLVAPWVMARAGGPMAQPAIVLLACGVPLALLLRSVACRPWLLALSLLAMTVCMTWTEQIAVGARRVSRLRNFYGIYRVYDMDGQRVLQHGTTQHGRQYLDESRAGTPLAYYHPTTPAAGVLTSDAFAFRRIGMVGLGTGALVTYGKSGSEFTVFELDPDNVAIADRQFSYIRRARVRGVMVDCIAGDARLSLREVPDGAFDLFIVDAFSSGSIPVHLITLEAFAEYRRVLTPSGMVLLHISNRALDLHPVVYSAARALGASAFERTNAGQSDPDANETFWMAVTADDGAARTLAQSLKWTMREPPPQGWPRPWTDQYANLLGAMLWK